MTIGRIIRNGDGFQFIELDEIEQEEVLRSLIDRNLNLFVRIDKAVSDFLLSRHIVDPQGIQQRITLAIFETVAIRSATMLHGELNRKIRLAKEDQASPDPVSAEKTDLDQSIEQENWLAEQEAVDVSCRRRLSQ